MARNGSLRDLLALSIAAEPDGGHTGKRRMRTMKPLSTGLTTTLTVGVSIMLGSLAFNASAIAGAGPADTAAQSVAVPEALVPEDLTLEPRPVIFVLGGGLWDDAEEKLGEAFSSIYGAIAEQKLHAAGKPMVEYLDSDEEKFQFRAMVPIEPADQPHADSDVQVGTSPSGKVLKFVHHGSLDDLEGVYNRIDDYLAAKSLSMKKVVEEYQTEQSTTPPNKMVTNIYVFTE
jgi:effector-binding domain-containing protein